MKLCGFYLREARVGRMRAKEHACNSNKHCGNEVAEKRASFEIDRVARRRLRTRVQSKNRKMNGKRSETTKRILMENEEKDSTQIAFEEERKRDALEALIRLNK